jgi:hypothetical protein
MATIVPSGSGYCTFLGYLINQAFIMPSFLPYSQPLIAVNIPLLTIPLVDIL